MDRPSNPFRNGSIVWEVMEGALQEEFDGLAGWSDLNSDEIAEVLGTYREQVVTAIGRIKKNTGYHIRYIKRKPRKKKCVSREAEEANAGKRR